MTIDADSTMSTGTLVAIDRALSSETTVGGGTLIRPNRSSPGIPATLLIFQFSGGLFWCCREISKRSEDSMKTWLAGRTPISPGV